MMVAVCMPLHGDLITFQKDGELDREYCIARNYSQTIKGTSGAICISGTAKYTLGGGEKALKIKADVDDVIEITTYIKQQPYRGVSILQSIGKQIAITNAMHNSVVVLSKTGYTIQNP